MARLEKQGLDYFSHDVDLSNDEKIQLIESEYNLTGYAIIVKLFERIYRNSYFIKCDEKFIKLFSKNNNIEINVCKNIINACIYEDIFNEKLYKNYNILTSSGIQTRYFEVVKRRKKVEIIEEFLLIDINVDINRINVDINSINGGNKKQKKVKESKGKEKEIDEIINYLNKKCNKNLRITTKEYRRVLNARLNNYTVEKLKQVIDIKFNDPFFIEKDFMQINTLFGSDGKVEKYLNWKPKETGRREDNIPEVNY